MMEKYSAPDSVLDAPVASLSTQPALRGAYADDARVYPIHTPAAAWVSAAYFLDNGSGNAKVAAEIKAALLRHRMWDEWERLAEAADMNRRIKSAAAATTRFALPDQRRYPLDTPDDVARAVDYFDKYASAFDAAERKTYARSVVEAIKSAGLAAADDTMWRLEAEAGLGRLSKSWRAAVTVRTKLAADSPEVVDALDKAAAFPPPDPLELVCALRELDKVAGWDLPDPLTAVIDETPTSAARKLASVVRAASGRWYSVGDVGAVPEAEIDLLVAPVTVASGEKRAALLADPTTCPAFEALLVDRGVAHVWQDRERPDWQALSKD